MSPILPDAMISTVSSYAAPRQPRRRHRGRNWLITLLVLVALLVAADRIAVAVAEHEVAATLQNSQHLPSAPMVDIAGIPFLTQLVSDRFGRVTVTADDIDVGDSGRRIRLDRVTVHLHDASVARDFSSVHAASATVAALVSYGELSRVLEVPISYAGPSEDGAGRVRTSASATVFGQRFTGTVSAEVRVSSADGLSFVQPRVTVAEQSVPAQVTDALTAVLGPIPLGQLPFDVAVQGVSADASGVTIRLAGSDLTFSQ